MKVIKLIVGAAAAAGVAVGALAICKHVKKIAESDGVSPTDYGCCPNEMEPCFGSTEAANPFEANEVPAEETIPVFNEATTPVTAKTI